ncbi:MAG: transporter [Verrucomicrobiota bacterium]|nr:transporter [Verrucomicrobiota bacterium]
MKNFILTVTILCGFTLNSSIIFADESHSSDKSKWNPGRPDSHAPIGVMGEHTHGANEYMLSYRFMSMEMNGHRQGSHSLSSADVFGLDYDIAALDMSMDMHMFGFMYAPSDELTFMGMFNFVENSMNMLHKPSEMNMGDNMGMGMGMQHHGDKMNHRSSGIGDISIGGLYKFYDEKNQRTHLNLSVVLPTAGVEESAHGMLLPYGMQLGSGTWDLRPGITWLGQSGSFSYGAQVMATIRLEDENDAGYALGDRLDITAWLAQQLTNGLSASVRLSYTKSDPIEGHFHNAHNHNSPTFFKANYGGDFVEGGIGLNWQFKKGAFKGHRLAIEGIFPLDQDPNGIGMDRDYTVIAGWQFAF